MHSGPALQASAGQGGVTLASRTAISGTEGHLLRGLVSVVLTSGFELASGAQLDGWFQQAAAQVLEQPQSGGGHGEPRHPAEARSSTAQTRLVTDSSPGRRPMTLTRRRVSPKVRSMKLECLTRVQCSRGNRR